MENNGKQEKTMEKIKCGKQKDQLKIMENNGKPRKTVETMENNGSQEKQ